MCSVVVLLHPPSQEVLLDQQEFLNETEIQTIIVTFQVLKLCGDEPLKLGFHRDFVSDIFRLIRKSSSDWFHKNKESIYLWLFKIPWRKFKLNWKESGGLKKINGIFHSMTLNPQPSTLNGNFNKNSFYFWTFQTM